MIILLNSLYVTGPGPKYFGPGPARARLGPGPGSGRARAQIFWARPISISGGGGQGPLAGPPPGPGYNGPAWPCYHYYSLPTITIIISYHIYPYQYHIISSQKMGKNLKNEKVLTFRDSHQNRGRV